MKLSRRGFFKAAAAAPIAGRAVVEKAAEDMALGQKSFPNWNLPYPQADDGSYYQDSYVQQNHWIDRLNNLVRELAKVDDIVPTIDDFRSVNRLDTDLAYNRSLSMATKIRIQAERNVAVQRENSKSAFQLEIEKTKKLIRGVTE